MNSSEPGCNGVGACALGLISMQENLLSKRKLDIFLFSPLAGYDFKF